MIHVQLFKTVGSFAENKDLARKIRMETIVPALDKGKVVILDFKKIESATQSFIHALISDLIRKYGNEVLEKISFKNCNETIKKIITIVIDYMQESE
ncbi:MAG: hypothetical protein A3I11_04825 [Elusimicrobia bacterium RIFCSPLOWO2_02_FULL_39_32]|nr:MAG: hypothetical protein A2034_06790 [Elusimicrobia bacterium GWA2_38_7]OGR80122.1 MAG: hypothetical protein A3B80_00780 [Elusimicrobia bacterium RIFCSPHIGHO2_02_FULL_39_36]OGR91083.1 MAG: hypothetical protein A3I11_04825 [Elusimicrobia bacterium RIFCSPLOWO2_02_FULL_39_32]OGS00050.1 MAG: hypothetical protein A3G85_07790 [Elusimicrobia bacterium RIFCSPLOWO2_12_FULL_39_28]